MKANTNHLSDDVNYVLIEFYDENGNENRFVIHRPKKMWFPKVEQEIQDIRCGFLLLEAKKLGADEFAMLKGYLHVFRLNEKKPSKELIEQMIRVYLQGKTETLWFSKLLEHA
jgi:hypothetical protein